MPMIFSQSLPNNQMTMHMWEQLWPQGWSLHLSAAPQRQGPCTSTQVLRSGSEASNLLISKVFWLLCSFFHIHAIYYSFTYLYRLNHTAYSILAPQPGTERGPWHWKYQVLTTGLPGNSLHANFSIILLISRTEKCSRDLLLQMVVWDDKEFRSLQVWAEMFSTGSMVLPLYRTVALTTAS